MKKILLLAVLISASFAASAQTGFINGFGFKAGLNIAELTDVDHVKMKPSFYAGVFKEFTISEKFGIQPELIYSRQGAKYRGAGGNEIRYNYLNLPIIAKIYPVKNFSIDLGPQFGYLLNSSIENVGVGAGKVVIIADGLKENKVDVSWAMGMTYSIGGMVDVTARYNLGLTKAIKANDGDAKNSVIQIGLGYRF